MQQPPPPPQEQQSLFEQNPSYQGQPQPGYPPYPGYVGQPAYSPYSGSPFPVPPQRSPSKIVLRQGLIFGVILAGGALLQSVISQMFLQAWAQDRSSMMAIILNNLLLSLVFTLVYWSIYFFMGFLTARRTQRVEDASRACLWASLCYLAMYCLIVGYNTIRFLSMVGARFIEGYLTSVGTGLVLVLVLNVGMGIGAGALGGVFGRSAARKQVPPQPMPPAQFM